MLIAHTTDLSDRDLPAFEHALALAVASNATLASVHAGESGADFPDASVTLARWGIDTPVPHQKLTHGCCDDIADTILDALRRLEPDLLVCSTHARTGLARVFGGSIGEGVARNVAYPTLLLPSGGRAFIDPVSGRLRLDRVLIPVGTPEDAQRGCDAAVELLRSTGAEATLHLVHVADGRLGPTPSLPPGQRCVVTEARGPLDEALAAAADEVDADLVVMVSHGHDGIVDVLLGSHAERLLHRTRRPLLFVPAGVRTRAPKQ